MSHQVTNTSHIVLEGYSLKNFVLFQWLDSLYSHIINYRVPKNSAEILKTLLEMACHGE